MKRFLFASLLIASFGSIIAAEYQLDPSHTNARFAVDHHETSTNIGGFFMLEGKLTFDATKKTGSVDIVIPMSKMNTGNATFDEHIKAPSYFNAEKYPEMRFTSDKFVFDGDKVSAVHGKLTLLGQTKPVVLEAKKFNCYYNTMVKKDTCGGDFEAKIQALDWGMNLKQEVDLRIQVEAFKE